MKEADYRFVLQRSWIGGEGLVNFVMLNPSTADALQDDATIRRCVGFAKLWGFSELVVTNLFAYRSTSPAALASLSRSIAVGNWQNDAAIETCALQSKAIICAWGDMGTLYARDSEVLARLTRGGRKIFCIGLTRSQNPMHPVRAPYTPAPISFRGPQ